MAAAGTGEGSRYHNILQYGDDGCWVHPHCLECPLPLCVLDEDGQAVAKQARLAARDALWATIRAAHEGGATSREIQQRLGISRRTVERALDAGKKGGAH